MTSRSAKRKKRNHEARIAKYKAFTDKLVEEQRLRYVESVRADLTRAEIVNQRCLQFVKALVAEFPDELTAQAGFFCTSPFHLDDPVPGEEHWWCKTKSGVIFDPTFEQFCSSGYYVEYRRDYHHVYRGKCMACGVENYDVADAPHKSTCSEECAQFIEDEYNRACSN